MFEQVAPSKNNDRVKNASFRLTEEEYYELHAMAAREHMSTSNFLRALLQGHRIREQRRSKK